MIGGIVLCGGQSRRMGSPKAWLSFGPEFMLQRVTRQLNECIDQVIVVGSREQELPVLPTNIQVVHDPVSHLGPLHGLATGLSHFTSEIELVYLTAVDSPFLIPGWIARLVDRMGDSDLAIVESDGRLQPLSALYRRDRTLTLASKLLEAGEKRLVELCFRLPSTLIAPREMREIDPFLWTLRNLNTPEEYHQALEDGLPKSARDAGQWEPRFWDA